MSNDFFGLGGHVIDGQFHAIEIAGEGGFSVVYRGLHVSLREPIAIKCLKIQVKQKDPAIVASFTQRFFDESRIMYRLSQGNLDIVRSITSGVTMSPATGATVPYMVLEWLDGVSLSKDMKDRRAAKAPGRTLAEVIALFEPAALAIAYAHSQGVVHRDVKPGNLFLHAMREGVRMKVLDFGMAKVLQPETMGGLESAATLGGVMVVSPQYVTPEQLDPKSGPVGPWSDVYAFALILVEALTGQRARDAETFADMMHQVMRSPPPTPRVRGAAITDAANAVFEKALAKDTQRRHPDLGAFWADLKRVASSAIPSIGGDDLEARTSTDQKIPDFARTVGMPESLPTEVRRFLEEKDAKGIKTNFAQTMPLAQVPRASAAPTVKRPFAGTMPLQQAAFTPSPQAAAISPASKSGGFPQQAPVQPPPMPMQQPVQAMAPPPRISAPAMQAVQAPQPPQYAPPQQVSAPLPPKRKTSGVVIAFFLLFIVLALAASGFVLYRTLMLQR